MEIIRDVGSCWAGEHKGEFWVFIEFGGTGRIYKRNGVCI